MKAFSMDLFQGGKLSAYYRGRHHRKCLGVYLKGMSEMFNMRPRKPHGHKIQTMLDNRELI